MNTNLNRRDILKALGFAGGYATSFSAISKPLLGFGQANTEDRGALVVIFQRGACDGFSIIGPNSGQDLQYYNQIRKGVGIDAEELINPEYSLGDSGYSVNPMLLGKKLNGAKEGDELISVTGGLQEALQSNKLTFFPGTHVAKANGSPFVGSMSHFTAQDILEFGGSGYDIGKINRRLNQYPGKSEKGWIARSVNIPEAFGKNLKVFGFNADKSLLGLSQQGFFVSANPAGGIDWTYAAHRSLQDRLKKKIQQKNSIQSANQREESWRHLQEVLLSSVDDLASYQADFENTRQYYRMINHDGRYKPSAMAKVLADTEVLLSNYPDLQFITINQNQYDTHSDQNYRLSHLLKDLGDNLGVFYDRMSTSPRQVQVLVVTEFGRTFDTNGTGTDHGQGYTMMVMSAGNSPSHRIAPVYFGPDYGNQAPSLENNWIVSARGRLHVKPIQDYRTILTEILAKRLNGANANPFDAASPFAISQNDFANFLPI